MNINGFRTSSRSSSNDGEFNAGASRYGANTHAPTAKALLDGYRGSITSPSEERPKFNPLNQSRPRSSPLLNVNDSVAMHLLVETAMGDSQQFEVVSFEEVDEMKKELTLLQNRIEATKRRLALESKVHDAARSLNRLYSKNGRVPESESPQLEKKHRRSIFGSRGSGSDLLMQTDDELTASNRKCEDLAQELWRLEKRAGDIQMRLLHHTAGILQMTHKNLSNDGQNGRPSSPESMIISDSRENVPILGEEFDERSLYRMLDGTDDFGASLRPQSRSLSRSPARRSSQSPEFAQQTDTIIATEKKLEHLNSRLREVIMHASHPQHDPYEAPPSQQVNGTIPRPGAVIDSQLEYLEKGIEMINRQSSESARKTQEAESGLEERLEELNHQLHNIIESQPHQDTDYHPPPQASGQTLQSQLDYLEEGMDAVEQRLYGMARDAESSSTKSTGYQEKVGQYNTVLVGLWEIILSGEEEARQRKREKGGTGSGGDSDVSQDESSGSGQQFSLQSFSAKVQSLYAQATGLREQKKILRRQVEQQRLLSADSDEQKEAELTRLAEELDHTKVVLREVDKKERGAREEIEEANRSLIDSEKEARGAREELMVVMKRLDEARRETTLKEHQRTMEESAALKAEKEAKREAEEELAAESEQLKQKQREITKLEDELVDLRDDTDIERKEMQSQIGLCEARIKDLTEQLQGANHAKTEAEEAERRVQGLLEERMRELERVEGEMVRLHTEVTVAKAELDGAYGTRAQRAAEVAANPAIQKELDELIDRNSSLLKEIATLKAARDSADSSDVGLQKRVEALQRELSETISDYEAMTKSSIEFEKEREQLEGIIDDVRDRAEELEAKLSDEKVRWLGMKSPGGDDAPPVQSTSTTVLKNEFKKMMRDTRAENSKAIRAEQEERRRLEALIRNLRKDQIPGKSSLSQSDAIRQALRNKQLYNIFVIPSVYLLTLICTVLIFASRLFTNRSVLAGIPKTYVPTEKGDVSKSVRRMITERLARSRRIAWEARPRDLSKTHTPEAVVANPSRPATRGSETKSKGGSNRNTKAPTSTETSQKLPPWGIVAHRGWSSPSSPDLPNLQYTTVISELPHLIEAKAVSLAPPDPTFTPAEPDTIIPPDSRAVALLQRSATLGLRDYLSYLTTLNLITPPTLSTIFLSQYENARFSTVPITEIEFRALMRSFAEILRGMTYLNPTILSTLLSSINADDDDDDDNVSILSNSSLTTSLSSPTPQSHPQTLQSQNPNTDPIDSISPTPHQQEHQHPRPNLNLPIPSTTSPLQTPRPSYLQTRPSSTSRGSQSSVIRLNQGLLDEGELPYTINSAPV
ncbi:MAG: hypothetical protein M1812_004869 [Candelaria pacifica]|nr:MAG: hypothetical protein M1812_004869 [Candelaria pacifica]